MNCAQTVRARFFGSHTAPTAAKALIAAVMLTGAALLSGCFSQAGWVYQPNPAERSPVKVPLTLAVSQFQDIRATENHTHFFLCEIPLIPYCEADYHRPDAANGFETAFAYAFRPKQDFAEAAAIEIGQTGMFQQVFQTERQDPPDAQLVLHGTVIKTDWQGTRYAYGVGGDSNILWLLGLPIGTVHDTVEVKLKLVDRATGAVLWSCEINREYEKTEGLYYNYSEDFGYPAMFRKGMKQALASMEQYVESKPPSFWQQMKPPE